MDIRLRAIREGTERDATAVKTISVHAVLIGCSPSRVIAENRYCFTHEIIINGHPLGHGRLSSARLMAGLPGVPDLYIGAYDYTKITAFAQRPRVEPMGDLYDEWMRKYCRGIVVEPLEPRSDKAVGRVRLKVMAENGV